MYVLVKSYHYKTAMGIYWWIRKMIKTVSCLGVLISLTLCTQHYYVGHNLCGGSYLPSQEWLQTISQTASSQRSLANNKKDIVLYITTLGRHKHNKRRAKSIKHEEQMEERQIEWVYRAISIRAREARKKHDVSTDELPWERTGTWGGFYWGRSLWSTIKKPVRLLVGSAPELH